MAEKGPKKFSRFMRRMAEKGPKKFSRFMRRGTRGGQADNGQKGSQE